MTTTPLTPAEPPELGVSPTPLPVPEDFPVEWPDPADEGRLWMRDRMHWPDPVTPLAFSMMEAAFPGGLMAAARALSAPLGDLGLRRINTYFYMGAAPPPPAPPEEMAAAGARSEAALEAAMARLRDDWEREYLPEIHMHLAAWEAFDLPGATMSELLAHLDDTLARFTRLMELHFLAVFPAYVALSELDEFHRQERALATGAFDAYRLVAGIPNKTVEVGHALWQLSRTVREQPRVLSTLVSRWPTTADALAALADTSEGAAFLVLLRRYLEDYGQRGDKFFDLERPAWIEDPSPVLDRLRAYVAQPDEEDPARAQQELAAEREQARVRVRQELAAGPPEARDRFEFLLAAASTGVVISEDHGFWIDFRAAYKVRRVLSELGWRLVPAAINVPTDVVFLTLDELVETATAERTPDRRTLVEARRAEMAHFAAIRPPEQLGTPLPPPPPGLPPDRFMRSMGKFNGRTYGAPEPDAPARDPAVVTGHPGSPGTVRGVARIIRNLDDAGRLEPGDVLVAETTTPPWTPLFATLAAVVTDTGGILSHCAVVAREYGMPAVVGTGDGTDRIPDGAVVEVDGDAGVVRIVG
ncbi:MAG: PEP-utilizing enzyme [Acidimicrobiia bacterium]